MDPLRGKREEINAGAQVIVFPGGGECPVTTGEEFILRSTAIRVGQIQRVLVKGKWEWRVQLIHQEPTNWLSTRPTPPITGEDRSFSYREEHGYGTHDELDAGAAAPLSYREEQRIEEENLQRRKLKRSEVEVLRQEAKLNAARRRGHRRTARVVRLELKRLDDGQEAA